MNKTEGSLDLKEPGLAVHSEGEHRTMGLLAVSERGQHIIFFLLLTVIALAAMACLRASTPTGLGLDDDSTFYINGARNILAGQGYTRSYAGDTFQPVTHYPPLFSVLLAGGSIVTDRDPIRTARGLLIFLWGLSAFLGGWWVWRMSRSLVAGLLFAFLFAVDAKLLFVYAMIMSEPLFIVFTLGTLLTLAVYFDSRRWPWLLVAGALSALAYLTRYSGLALLATVALVLFIVEPSWKKKVGSLIIYLAGALPFVLAWALRNALLGLSMTNRVFRYHPLPATKVEAGVHQVLEWLIPTSLPDSISTLRVLSILKATVTEGTAPYLVIGLIGAALLAWLIIVSVQLWSRGDQDSVRVPFFSSMAYLFVYLLAIVLSMMFFDASTPFTDRILAPVYIGLLVGFVMLAVTVWRTQSGPLRALVIICLIGASVLSLVNTRQAMAHLRKNPLGFAAWRNSETMALIKELPSSTFIYSNEPEGVYILTGRPATMFISSPIDGVRMEYRSGYEAYLDQVRAQLMEGKAVLVIFQPEALDQALLADLGAGVPEYARVSDGVILGMP